jgi:dTDP-glucose 4,6-dehydratase
VPSRTSLLVTGAAGFTGSHFTRYWAEHHPEVSVVNFAAESHNSLAVLDPGRFFRTNASKAGADHAVRADHETFGLPVTLTNCADNYGSHRFPGKVLPPFATRAVNGQPPPAANR